MSIKKQKICDSYKWLLRLINYNKLVSQCNMSAHNKLLATNNEIQDEVVVKTKSDDHSRRLNQWHGTNCIKLNIEI